MDLVPPGRYDGEREPAGILPECDQEHLGRVSPEHPAGGGLLLGIRSSDCDGKTLPWGLCWDKGGAGLIARGECGRLVGFCGHLGRRGVSVPADRICGPAEVPP